MDTFEVVHLQTLDFIPHLNETTQFCLNCILILFSPRLSSELEVSSHGLPDPGGSK